MIENSLWFKNFLLWRNRNVDQRTFVLFLSLFVGLASGMAAVILKNTVFYAHLLLTQGFAANTGNLLYLAYPLIGIILLHRTCW